MRIGGPARAATAAPGFHFAIVVGAQDEDESPDQRNDPKHVGRGRQCVASGPARDESVEWARPAFTVLLLSAKPKLARGANELSAAAPCGHENTQRSNLHRALAMRLLDIRSPAQNPAK
jgi:hypothetical protein